MSNQNLNEEIAIQKWFRQLKEGLQQGIAASPEDRREALTAIRELQGKAEGPRVLYTLVQNPMIDLLRQRATFGNKSGFEAGYLPHLSDDALLYRANKGLLIGPQPQDAIPKELWYEGQPLPADPIRNQNEMDEDYNKRAKPARERRLQNLQVYKSALQNTPLPVKLGGAIGATAADLSHDATRGLWWLINSGFAIGNLTSEVTAAAANPDLFGARPLEDLAQAEKDNLVRYVKPDVKTLDNKTRIKLEQARREYDAFEPLPNYSGTLDGFIDNKPPKIPTPAEARAAVELEERKNPRNYVASAPGVKNVRGGFRQRRFNPSLVNFAAMLPAGVALNAGAGLLGSSDSGTIIPGTGRKEGYAASVPSEDDPRVTDNVALEATTKFLLGREGQLLPWSEGFQTERPDVSRREYNAYKAYERSKDIDLNVFDDGIANLGGVLKVNTNEDAIHGPEIQFLGKNFSLNESFIPTGAALLGTLVGGLAPNVRRIRRRKSNPNLERYIPKMSFERENGKIKRDASGSPVKRFNYEMDGNEIVRDQYGRKLLKQGLTFEGKEDLGVNKYSDDGASLLTKAMGQFPEVIPRDPNSGRVVINENLADNKQLQKVENFFLKKDADGKITDRQDLRRDRVIGALALGGTAGAIGGSILGGDIEEERRRRNFESNNPGIDFETFKKNSERIGKRQLEMALANPDRDRQKKESKKGFSNRTKQESLMEDYQLQAAAIDTIADKYIQGLANEKLNENKSRLERIDAIERDIYENKYGEDAYYPY